MPDKITAADYQAKYARKPPSGERSKAPEGQGKPKGKKATPARQTANQITAAAVLWLNLNGFKAWRNNSAGIWDAKQQTFRKNKAMLKGVSDVIGYEKGTGRSLFIEVKAGKDRLSPEQELFLKDAEAAGCIAGCIRESRDIETIIQKFKKSA